MAYSGLTITTAVHDEDNSSHCIPAYPEYYSSTTFNTAFYTERQASNDELAGATIIYNEV
tara:strand:+ start:340 stop:519 length:180 start_codon:yes stop_codon:yes gene_type:complete